MDFSNVAVDGMANLDATDICNGWLGTRGSLSDTGGDVAVFWINVNDADLYRFAYGERRGERCSRVAVADISSCVNKTPVNNPYNDD